MNYQITCVCGNKFVVPETQMGKHVVCPACNRALMPVAATSTPVNSLPTDTDQRATKHCPYCGETILAVAKKCRFCNEFLDRPAPTTAPVSGGFGPGLSPPAASLSGVAPALPPTGATSSTPIFEVSVSQWDNFFRYAICLAIVIGVAFFLFGIKPIREATASWNYLAFIIVLLLTAISAYFIFLGTHNSRCRIRPDRIETESGIFSKKSDQIDLIRVIDLELRQNLLERMLGMGTLVIKSNDPTTPTLELYQIAQARAIYKYLQDQIPKADVARRMLRVES